MSIVVGGIEGATSKQACEIDCQKEKKVEK